MTERERCENCDRPKATDEEYQTIAGGEGEHLCWNAWAARCEPEDWRARALKAEETVKRAAVYLATGPKAPHENCEGTCAACYYEGLVQMLVESMDE